MKISRSISVFEASFLKSEKLFTLISQIVFFHAAESAILPTGQKATSLFTLMLFNGLAYSLSYLHGVISNSSLGRLETVGTSSDVPHLAMSATKLTLEWTKLVVFFMTLVSISLALCLGVSMQGFSPSPCYLVITGLYFLTQEEMVVVNMPRLLVKLPSSVIEGEEAVWSPIILKGLSLLLSLTMVLLCTFYRKYKSGFTSFIICVYLKIRDLDINGFEKLRRLEKLVARFPLVSASDLSAHDDVCSICLSDMRRARRTYCGHIFHPVCLARALKTVSTCPVCKQNL
eukprot:TRINITY_DN13232_c0_g1_i1.p1 TRINITY_DN13232_c0_g1~~TRINITY_DN13232_c0_g1_i1.p1  ORF type:complete len:287 (-),score=91.33 TRINITY_DN13232_c0_g1_i1:45-905(-)